MLTGKLVPFRKRKDGTLGLVRAEGPRGERAIAMADSLASKLRASIGSERRVIETRLRALSASPADRALLQGLVQLYLDACTFEGLARDVAEARRSAVFQAAAEARKAGTFDAEAILAAHGIAAGSRQAALYGDIESEHVLRSVPTWTSAQACELYNDALEQGALVHAEEIVFHIDRAHVHGLAPFFRALKFRGLFTALTSAPAHVEVRVSGPSALFRASSRDGLRVALAMPTLRAVCDFTLHATLKRRRGDRQVWTHTFTQRGTLPPQVPYELEGVVERFASLASPWSLKAAKTLLTYEGGDVAIPELVAERGPHKVFIEVFGPWSRARVFDRLANPTARAAGDANEAAHINVLLCVPKKARVKEKAEVDDPHTRKQLSHKILAFDEVVTAERLLDKLDALYT